jgi:hypothetical protein
MTTIQRTIDIPPDLRLRLDLPIPPSVPAGPAEIQVIIAPLRSVSPKPKPFEGLAGSLKNSSLFSRDAVELQREMRDEW